MATILEVDLRPVDRPQPQRVRGLRVLHRPADTVVVGQREDVVALLERRRHELLGQRGAVEERVGGVAVELGVHANTCSHARRSLHPVGPPAAAATPRCASGTPGPRANSRSSGTSAVTAIVAGVERLGDVGAGEGGAGEHAASLVDHEPAGARRAAAVEAAAGDAVGGVVDGARVDAGLLRRGQRVADGRHLGLGEDHARRERAVVGPWRSSRARGSGRPRRAPGTCPCA